MNDPYVADLHRQLLEAEERHVQAMVGLRVHHTTQVSLRRPRWMPDRLYRWLMRSIVVVNGPIVVGDIPAAMPKPPEFSPEAWEDRELLRFKVRAGFGFDRPPFFGGL